MKAVITERIDGKRTGRIWIKSSQIEKEWLKSSDNYVEAIPNQDLGCTSKMVWKDVYPDGDIISSLTMFPKFQFPKKGGRTTASFCNPAALAT